MMATVAFPAAGAPVDLTPFAAARWWEGDQGRTLQTHDLKRDSEGCLPAQLDPKTGEWQVGLEWEMPRDVCRVVVRFAGDIPAGLAVQYWRRNWPTPAPERMPGARRGWIGRDDPFHGAWTRVHGEQVVVGSDLSLIFDPLDLPEISGWEAADQLDNAEHYRATFRRTLKLRLVARTPFRVAAIEAYSPATWREETVDVRLGVGSAEEADWSGRAQVVNGYLLGMESLDFAAGDALHDDGSWALHTAGAAKGLRLRLLAAECAADSNDQTIVTLRTRAHSFSFQVSDLARGPIPIPDYHVLVTRAGATAEAPMTGMAPIYDRVEAEPEHSYQRALAEIPRLDVTKTSPFGRYLPLTVEAGRQEMAIRYNGEFFGDKRIMKLHGRDAARLQWPSHEIRYRFGTGDPADFREGRREATKQSLLQGWLPVVISEWLDREIEYTQTAFAALLDGPMTGQDARRGDEDVVFFLRFRIRNTTHGCKRARLLLAIAPQEQLRVQEGLLLAEGRVAPAEPVARQWKVQRYATPVLRAAATAGKGSLSAVPFADQPGASQAVTTAMAYEVDLAGGEADTLTLTVPFASLTQAAEWQKAAALDYDAKLADVVDFWQGYILGGGQMDLPDADLGDFHRAVRTHVAISADKDPVSGLIMVPAATWAYGVCGNEAIWQIHMLDQAGHHDRAEIYLETYLRTQGAKMLDGNFQSAEGVVTGLDIEAGEPSLGHFAYNLDPGYVMECLANHYRYTGDRAWLDRVAGQLVAACDFVVRERQATRVNGPDGQPVAEWGLLPCGHLEDNPEWRHWFAVNAHAYGGMKAIADVLSEVGHPEAERLQREAAAYRADIRQAARRAMVEAPVVRLLDGNYVPHIPTRTGLRGREWGWFREAAYGALHLMECGVLAPDEPEVTWLLKDLEDNLFVSRDWGRPVDLERYWFSHGGATIQSNLLDLGIDYLRRGQVKHALRALFNNFGSQLYPDVRAYTEHPVIELGHGVGPFYKSSDEAKALVWLRAFLLREEGDVLHLAEGAPQAWFAAGQHFGVSRMASFFGPVSYRVQAGASEVTVTVDTPARRSLRALVVHLRRPGLQAVTVNGRPHNDFDPTTGAVRIAAPAGSVEIKGQF